MSIPQALPTAHEPWTLRRDAAARPVPTMPPMTHRYRVSWLNARGEVEDFVRMGPGTPLFVRSFAALVRGALLATPDGPVAVEDAYPGMKIVTRRGPKTLLWVGGHTVVPRASGTPLYRLPADAMGLGRPSPDLVLGPGARLVGGVPAQHARVGRAQALLPVSTLADGQSVIEIAPVSAVPCFHLGFRAHQTFTVNGIEIESVHPGALGPEIGDDLRRYYLGMFPHVERPEDFGVLAMRRLPDRPLGAVAP